MDNVHWTVLNKRESNNSVGSAIIAQVYKKQSFYFCCWLCLRVFFFFLFVWSVHEVFTKGDLVFSVNPIWNALKSVCEIKMV